MTQKLGPSDPGYHQAIQDMKDEFGLSIPDILLPTHWGVILVDGKPMVVVTPDGMRALALVSPRPQAPEYVENLIKTLTEKWGE
jgi:hypothetical protein